VALEVEGPGVVTLAPWVAARTRCAARLLADIASRVEEWSYVQTPSTIDVFNIASAASAFDPDRTSRSIERQRRWQALLLPGATGLCLSFRADRRWAGNMTAWAASLMTLSELAFQSG